MKNFEQLEEKAKSLPCKKLSVAAANDRGVLEAVGKAYKNGLIKPVLVGSKLEIENVAKEISFNLENIEIINAKDDLESARIATEIVHNNKADILMKGLVSTADILRQVLNKEIGLRTGNALSQVAIFQSPNYHKLFMVTDPAMNIAPDYETKKDIIENAVELAKSLGISRPKIAVLAAMEKVSDSMQATLDAKELTDYYADRKEEFLVYGPLALDNAVSRKSANIKKIQSEVAGDADILLVPHIDAGNILYKSLTFLGGSDSAGIILGAQAPIVLTSRADNFKAKYNSIVLATILANK